MGAGSEGPARVDHDREGVRLRGVPGRPDPERPDPDGVMELAPALLPAVVDLGHFGLGVGCDNPDRRFAVGCELDGAGGLDLLESLGSELDEPSSKLLRFARLGGDGRADQLNALFSFSKKLGSCR